MFEQLYNKLTPDVLHLVVDLTREVTDLETILFLLTCF